MNRIAELKPQYVVDDANHRRMVLLSIEDYELLVALALGRPARETALLSEPALAKLWDTPEEDAAWRDL